MEIIGTILAALRRVIHCIVYDFSADIRDGISWISDKGPKVTALLIERWLGFCYAFTVVLIVGMVGYPSIELARWMSNQPLLADSVPWFILFILTIGFFVSLLWGIMFSALVIVSGVRVLFWVRRKWKNYWRKNTPPYTESETGFNTRKWPPSDDELGIARKKSWEYFKKGAFWFPVLTTTLLLVELRFSEQLYTVIEQQNLTSAGEFLNATVWLIDVGGLFKMPGFPLSPVQVVTILMIFGLPGVFMALSIRNLLFVTEAGVRDSIEKASSGSSFGWRWLLLLIQVFGFCIYGLGILFAHLYGL